MSKGSNRRPMQIPPEEFDQRWAETFGPQPAEPVYGMSVLDDPDIIAEQLQRNREAREDLDRLHEAMAKYVEEHRATLNAFGVGPLADPDGAFLRWSADREHG